MAVKTDNPSRSISQHSIESTQKRPIMNFVLWFIQVLLALLFVFGGVMKLITPAEVLAKQVPLPVLFVKFIGVAEFFGGLGLILPGLLRIKPGLTPLAASGLVIIMIGATWLTVASMGIPMALFPFITGLLCLFVANGRWRQVPHRDRIGSGSPNAAHSPLSTGS
jgi:uncharacterized membrane protein YphA (DoxX/SURF4 family)